MSRSGFGEGAMREKEDEGRKLRQFGLAVLALREPLLCW